MDYSQGRPAFGAAPTKPRDALAEVGRQTNTLLTVACWLLGIILAVLIANLVFNIIAAVKSKEYMDSNVDYMHEKVAELEQMVGLLANQTDLDTDPQRYLDAAHDLMQSAADVMADADRSGAVERLGLAAADIGHAAAAFDVASLNRLMQVLHRDHRGDNGTHSTLLEAVGHMLVDAAPMVGAASRGRLVERATDLVARMQQTAALLDDSQLVAHSSQLVARLLELANAVDGPRIGDELDRLLAEAERALEEAEAALHAALSDGVTVHLGSSGK